MSNTVVSIKEIINETIGRLETAKNKSGQKDELVLQAVETGLSVIKIITKKSIYNDLLTDSECNVNLIKLLGFMESLNDFAIYTIQNQNNENRLEKAKENELVRKLCIESELDRKTISRIFSMTIIPELDKLIKNAPEDTVRVILVPVKNTFINDLFLEAREAHQSGDEKRAQECLIQTLALGGSNPSTFVNVIMEYADVSEDLETLRLFVKEFCEKFPDDPERFMAKVYLYNAEKNFKEVLKNVEEYFKANPVGMGRQNALIMKATALYKLGKKEKSDLSKIKEAKKITESLLEDTDQKDFGAQLLMGKILYQQKEYGDAALHFHASVDLEPRNSQGVLGMIKCLVAIGNYKVAKDICQYVKTTFSPLPPRISGKIEKRLREIIKGLAKK